MNANTSGSNSNDRSGAVGAALYYGITAVVVVAIAVTVLFGKFFYRRRALREVRRRNDMERQAAVNRGEASGLPTYHEHRNTVPLNVPTLAYPDAARRTDGTHGASSQDPSLPSYDAAPPKYEYASGNNGATAAPTTALQRATDGIRNALSSSRPASLRRDNSSSEPEMQQTQTGLRVMTPAPAPMSATIPMHLTSQSRTHSSSSLRISTPAPAPAPSPSSSDEPNAELQNVSLNDNGTESGVTRTV